VFENLRRKPSTIGLLEPLTVFLFLARLLSQSSRKKGKSGNVLSRDTWGIQTMKSVKTILADKCTFGVRSNDIELNLELKSSPKNDDAKTLFR